MFREYDKCRVESGKLKTAGHIRYRMRQSKSMDNILGVVLLRVRNYV